MMTNAGMAILLSPLVRMQYMIMDDSLYIIKYLYR
jgi:hypothetical protein